MELEFVSPSPIIHVGPEADIKLLLVPGPENILYPLSLNLTILSLSPRITEPWKRNTLRGALILKKKML